MENGFSSVLKPDLYSCPQKEGFSPFYGHIKCNMSELVRILQVANECKWCLASRGSDVP